MAKRKAPAAAEIPTDLPPATSAAGDSTQPAPQASVPASESSRQPGDEPEKTWVKTASVIVDPEAGLKFHFDYENHKAVITFDEKPSPEFLTVAKPVMNGHGFHWDADSQPAGWAKRMTSGNWVEDRCEAKKTFYAVANAIRQLKGLPARSFGQALPF